MFSTDPSLRWKCLTCGKEHTTQQTYTRHVRQCKGEIKRLFDEQREIRDTVRKRRRLQDVVEPAPVQDTLHAAERSGFLTGQSVSQDAPSGSSNPPSHSDSQSPTRPSIHFHDLETPVAVRKSSRVPTLPSRFSEFVPSQPKRVQRTKDVFPEPPTGLPMEPTTPMPLGPSVGEQQPDVDPTPPSYVQSTANKFGLFRKYQRSTFPTHDPDVGAENDSFVDSHDSTRSIHSHTIPPELFHPYPNKSTYLLGRWQHNHKHSKSMRQFENLLDVLRDPDFKLSEIRGVNFQRIADKLASLEVRIHATHHL